MRKHLIGLICGIGVIGMAVSCIGCSKSIGGSNSVDADVDEDDVVNGEVYFSHKVNACISQYPELDTTDIVVKSGGWGPMLVSPYADEDVVKAVTHVICDTGIATYCYGDYLYDSYYDNFTNSNYEEAYEAVQARVDNARRKAIVVDNRLASSIERDSAINCSDDGEYYYIMSLENFEESVDAIQKSLDKQAGNFSDEMQFDCMYYFDGSGNEFAGGYRSYPYSIYLDSYEPENKVYEGYFWRSKHQWVNIYSDMYTLLIYDYTAINEESLNTNTDLGQLICYSSFYDSTDSGLRSVHFEYRMWSEEFEPDEAIALAYEVYTNIHNANIENNTYMIHALYIRMDNFTEYNKDYNSSDIMIFINEEYTFEEFELLIRDNIETRWDDEPV